MSGFSDVPLTVPDDAILYHDTFEAKYVTKYLEEYADNHNYNGKSLFERICFNHEVINVDKFNDTWVVKTLDPGNLIKESQPLLWRCPRLVVATCRTSVPKMPCIQLEPANRRDLEILKSSVHHHRTFGVLSHQPSI